METVVFKHSIERGMNRMKRVATLRNDVVCDTYKQLVELNTRLLRMCVVVVSNKAENHCRIIRFHPDRYGTRDIMKWPSYEPLMRNTSPLPPPLLWVDPLGTCALCCRQAALTPQS